MKYNIGGKSRSTDFTPKRERKENGLHGKHGASAQSRDLFAVFQSETLITTTSQEQMLDCR